MNVNLNNLNASISKQDSVKQTKNNDSEKKSSSFEESLNDSLNSVNKNKDLNKNVSKINNENEFKINEDSISDENLETLESIVYLLNLVCNEKIDNNENVFNFNDNLEINFSEEGSLNLFSENNIDENALSKILYNLGVDQNKIDLKNISKGEVVQNILDNSEGFKMIIKNEISQFDEENLDENILKFLDSENFLTDKELLSNIKNEISTKINRAISEKVSNENVEHEKINVLNQVENLNTVDEFKKLNSNSDIKNDTTNIENILKEISGEVELDKNIESYFVDTLRNSDLPKEVIEKTIDATDTTKFVKEFIESIKYMSTNNKSEMIVRINPEHLGKMDIKYEVVKDAVRLMIRVENAEALKLIDNTIIDIKHMIRENHQINLDNIHVDLQQFEFNSDNQNSRQNEGQDNQKSKNSIKIEDEEIIKDEKNLRSGILV